MVTDVDVIGVGYPETSRHLICVEHAKCGVGPDS
jgi:hypothetical protein